MMAEGNSEFFLLIYTVSDTEYQKQLGTLGEIFSYLEERGEVVGKLAFKYIATILHKRH